VWGLAGINLRFPKGATIMAIDAQTAISRLSGITTEAQLRALIAQVSVESPGKITLLYSGDFGKDSSGNTIKIWDAIAEAKKNPDIRLIDKTPAAEFLQSDEFLAKVREVFNSSPTEKGSPAYNFIDNARTGAWATISELFAKATKGDVVTWTVNAAGDRVFAVTEIGAVLTSDAKTINGLPVSEIKLYWNDVLATAGGDIEAARLKMVELMRATSFFNAQDKITLNGETKLIAEFMRAGMTAGALETQLASGKQALERLDALEKGLGIKVTKAGNVLAGLSLLIASAQASAATTNGDYDSAARIMGDWGSKFLGSLAAGYAAATVTGEVLSPLALSGPAGATVAFVASLVAGLAGGLYGDQVVTQMLAGDSTTAPVWDTAKVIEFAKRDDAQGLVWRKALYEMNPLVLLNAASDPDGQLALYNPETDQGSITEAWISDRAMMMEQVITAWRNGTGSGQFWRIDTFSTDTLYFEDKASGIRVQQVGLLGEVDGPSYLFGGTSADTLTGGDYADHLYGGAGSDTLDGGADADYLEGNAGDDSLNGGAGKDHLLGGTGDDTLTGNAGKDLLLGGTGDDTLDGGPENDLLLGSTGTDTYVFSDTYGTDLITDSDGQGRLTFGTQTLAGVTYLAENVYKDDTTGQIVVRMNGGESLVAFKEGNANRVLVKDWSETKNLGIRLQGNAPAAPATTLAGDFKKATDGRNYVINGNNYVGADEEIGALDLLTGTGGNDVIDGRAGDDALSGMAGDDYLLGGDGGDILQGGMGKDTLIGGIGDDLLYASSDDPLTLPTRTDFIPPANPYTHPWST